MPTSAGESRTKLEDLQTNAAVRGIVPDALVTVVSVQWFGSEALELTYKDPAGRVANVLLYRHDEPRIEVVEKDGGPRHTKQEGTGVIPTWKLSAPGLPPNNGLQNDAPQAARA